MPRDPRRWEGLRDRRVRTHAVQAILDHFDAGLLSESELEETMAVAHQTDISTDTITCDNGMPAFLAYPADVVDGGRGVTGAPGSDSVTGANLAGRPVLVVLDPGLPGLTGAFTAQRP